MILTALAASGCSRADPETAGNRTGWFFAAVQENRFADAYDMLCSETRNHITLDDFTATGGSKLSPILPNAGVNGGEGSSQMPDISTESRDVTSTWVEVIARRYESRLAPGQVIETNVPIERWRVDLHREGDWKLCSFRQV